MSYKTFLVEDLMKLDKKTLTTALRIFQQELDGTIALLTQEPDSAKDQVVLDDLESLLTLRRVFRLRIEELEAEGNQEEPGTSAQLLSFEANYDLLQVLKSDVTHAH